VIVNVASVQGHIGTPFSGGLAHAATTAGVSAMTRQLAAEGAQHGIRAVCISPGPIIAPEVIEAFGEALVEQLKPQLMVDRMGRADEVVSLAVHLASDDAGFITGSDYLVDGGMSAK
jgi:meso-butanediol dehydrogenase / (S,S)-butanediol dehydrogenase / diacetyl reductase